MEKDSMVTSGQVHKETEASHVCEHCKRAQEQQEMAFAFLIALMPVITLTLFGNMGLL
ncbi:MAG: hypothetical protein HGA38_03410 [Candidatus Moranbacteria bacterium]|nr:hypothetical protein [Candidatus Moranbacteria bacterium]